MTKIELDGLGIRVVLYNEDEEEVGEVRQLLTEDELSAVKEAFASDTFWRLFLTSVKDSIVDED